MAAGAAAAGAVVAGAVAVDSVVARRVVGMSASVSAADGVAGGEAVRGGAVAAGSRWSVDGSCCSARTQCDTMKTANKKQYMRVKMHRSNFLPDTSRSAEPQNLGDFLSKKNMHRNYFVIANTSFLFG